MSTLQVANLHLESTANNRIQNINSTSFSIFAGGSEIISSNSSVASGLIGPKLLQTVTVSSIASDNLTFNSIASLNYNNYLITFTGVSSNSASDTRWRLAFSTDNQSSYNLIGTTITDGARVDRFLDAHFYITTPKLSSNIAFCKVDSITGITGAATGTISATATGLAYGANNITHLRLYSQDAGRGFGTVGTIRLYGYDSLV